MENEQAALLKLFRVTNVEIYFTLEDIFVDKKTKSILLEKVLLSKNQQITRNLKYYRLCKVLELLMFKVERMKGSSIKKYTFSLTSKGFYYLQNYNKELKYYKILHDIKEIER